MTEQTAPTRRAFWVDPEHDPRYTDELPVGETTALRQYLDRYRMTFEMKCEGPRRSIRPPGRSREHEEPDRAVRHVTEIEDHWFRRTLEGQTDLPHLYHSEEDPDLDFDGAVGTRDCVADAWESWRREVAHAREVYARYDDLGETFVPGEPWQVRGVIVHMIEEYARHCGHADLLRECIDGRTGQ